MTTLFYAPPDCFRGDYVELPNDEAHHAGRVLRRSEGDEIEVVDGEGGWHRVRIDHADGRTVTGHVVETRREVGEPPYVLTVALALVKNRNRYETFLEKAVELGVRRVVPLLSNRTEKTGLKEKRAERILLAGMKQTGRSRCVRLEAPTPFSAFLRDETSDLLLLCHETAPGDNALPGVLAMHPDATRLTVLIGPEGGFTDEEVAAAREAGARVISLGPRRLRAETAAITAAAGVMLARS